MAKDMTVAAVLDSRAATYSMLARLYRSELDADYLAKLRQMRCPVNTGNVDVSTAGKMASSLSAGDPSDGVVLCIRERMDAGISSGIPPLL